MSVGGLDVPFCGLPCEGGCSVCRAAVAAPSLTGPPLVDGKPVTLEAAVAHAAGLLRAARRPIVHGLAQSASGTARLAAAVAARLRGFIDIEGSAVLQPEIDVLQSSGACSATFGAIRSSADVVLLWRTDPRATHPLFFGPAERRFIVVTEADGDLEAALLLRALVAGQSQSSGTLTAAADALRAARYAAIVYAPPATRALAAALQALAATLQEKTRAAAVSLGAGGNVAGAMAALLSACGLPRAVSFQDGTPRSCAGWSERASDAALLIGPQGADAASHPVIVVGPRQPPDVDAIDVLIPTAVPALSERGLWLRADGFPVRLAAPVASDLPREGDVLRLLLEAV